LEKLLKPLQALLFALSLSALGFAQNLATEKTTGNLEVVATFEEPMPTGVTVSKDGRIFVNFPKWADPVQYTVVEVKNGKTTPYPDLDWNRYAPGDRQEDKLVSVQSVVVDPSGTKLWILDTGSVNFGPVQLGGPKLLAVDLSNDKVVNKILFPADVALPTSYLNDVRFDLRRGKEGMAFITDSSTEGPNGIIVVDLASGKSWRRLKDHPSTKADAAFLGVVEGDILLQREPGKPPKKPKFGSDGIAISPDGKTLYYCALASRHLFSVSVDALADQSKSDQDVAATVMDLGEKGGASDGLESDQQNRVYLTDYEHDAIRRRYPDGRIETLAHDPRMLWPDTMSLGADGFLYFTANQLDRMARFHDGNDLRQPPYVLFKLKVDATRISQ
jgi:sugar lactone lactonase YvrE